MQFVKLQFKPGINREQTNYSAMGGWWDCDLVRFRAGLPEKFGGWRFATITAFDGICRCILGFVDLSGNQWIALGTNEKFYLLNGADLTDITPFRREVDPLTNNPLTTTNGSADINVYDVGHGGTDGDTVILGGATAFNNITADEINTSHVITVVDADNYTITVTSLANASSSGGGAAVTADYEISPGNVDTLVGVGWGSGGWGSGGWGFGSGGSTESPCRLWTADKYGEDLVFCLRDGPIYYWDATTPTVHAIDATDLPDQTGVPTVATEVYVSDADRHVVAFGANTLGSATQDKMLIRWSNTEDITDWTPTTENSAGDLRLSYGSYILTAVQTRQEILVWTDIALYSFQYVGAPFTFGATLLGADIDMIAPNAKVVLNDTVYWMGTNAFWSYDGRASNLDCSVRDYVFLRMNTSQRYKIYCGTNISNNEIIWFYPSVNSTEIDSYVAYNYVEKAWYIGESMVRTAWLDRGLFPYPQGTSTDGYVYEHEVGTDAVAPDGSTTTLSAYIETAPFELADDSGYSLTLIERIIPDLDFRNSTNGSAALKYTVKTMYWSMSGYGAIESDSSAVYDQTSTVEILTTDTQQKSIRLRGRAAALRVENDTSGTAWRLGVPRLQVRKDGRR